MTRSNKFIYFLAPIISFDLFYLQLIKNVLFVYRSCIEQIKLKIDSTGTKHLNANIFMIMIFL